MSKVLDYSVGRPDPNSIKRAGYVGVMRYISAAGGINKDIYASEFHALRAAGLSVGFVYENSASWMLGGYQDGRDAAKRFRNRVRRFHTDAEPVLYLGADWNAFEWQQDAIDRCLDGAASVIGRRRTGIYGGYWPLSRAMDAGKATYGWQTVAWSGSNRYDGAHLLQNEYGIWIDGVNCDSNDVLNPSWGQINGHHRSRNHDNEDKDVDMLNWRTFSYNPDEWHHGVEMIQCMLNTDEQTASYNITVDGYFGDDTDSRVRAFQRGAGIVVDGIVGTHTYLALLWNNIYGNQAPNWIG